MKKLIKLYKENCVPCKSVENFLESNNIKPDEEYDIMNNPEKAVEFGVMSVPVTILLDEEGNEITRSIGYKVPELEDLIETYLQK